MKREPGLTASCRPRYHRYVPTLGGFVPTLSQPKLLIVHNVPTSQRGPLFYVYFISQQTANRPKVGTVGTVLCIYYLFSFERLGQKGKRLGQGWDKNKEVGTMGSAVERVTASLTPPVELEVTTTAGQVAAYWREQTGRESVLIDGYGRVELQALAEIVAEHWPDELGRCIGSDWRGYLSTAARYALNLGYIQAAEPDQAPGYDPEKVIVKSPANSPSAGRYVSVADGIAEGWLDAHGNAPLEDAEREALVANLRARITARRRASKVAV